MVRWLAEQHGSQGRFGKAIRFDGTSGFVSTMLTGEDLGIDGKKSRTISFWTYVEDGNPRSQPAFMVTAKGLALEKTDIGQSETSRMEVTPNFCHSTGVGIQETS